MAGPRRVDLWRAGLLAQLSVFRMAPRCLAAPLVTKANVSVLPTSFCEVWSSGKVHRRCAKYSLGGRFDFTLVFSINELLNFVMISCCKRESELVFPSA